MALCNLPVCKSAYLMATLRTWAARWAERIGLAEGIDRPLLEIMAGLQAGRVGTQQVCQADEGSFILVCRHVSHQRQVLHQATALALWCVCWAQHAPLTGLQGAGPAYLHGPHQL